MDLIVILLVILLIFAIAGGVYVSPFLWILVLVCIVVLAFRYDRGRRVP